MTKALATISHPPRVYIRDGELVTSSQDVASHFGVPHRTIVKAVERRILDAQENGDAGCLALYRKTSIGRPMPNGGTAYSEVYEMLENGFILVAMGLTTKTARGLQLGYVSEFDRMREELRRQSVPAIPQASTPIAMPTATSTQIDMRNPAHYAMALAQVMEMVQEANAVAVEQRRQKDLAIAYIEEKAPLVEIAEDVVASEELMTLRQAARVLDCREGRFFAFLEDRFLYREDGALVPYAPYRREGLFRVKYPLANGKARAQTHVTGKGLAAIKAAMSASRRDLLSHLGRLPDGVTRTSPPAIGRPSS